MLYSALWGDMSARLHGYSQGLLGTAHAHQPSTGLSGLCIPTGCIYTLTNTLMMLWLADGPGSDFRKGRIWTGCRRTEALNDKNISIKNTNYGRNCLSMPQASIANLYICYASQVWLFNHRAVKASCWGWPISSTWQWVMNAVPLRFSFKPWFK